MDKLEKACMKLSMKPLTHTALSQPSKVGFC